MWKNYAQIPHPKSEWKNIYSKLQDFKSIFNNSILSNIILWLELYGVKLPEVEFLEKTLSTYHASNICYCSNANSVSIRHTRSWLLTIEQTNEIMIWDLLTPRHFPKQMSYYIIFDHFKSFKSKPVTIIKTIPRREYYLPQIMINARCLFSSMIILIAIVLVWLDIEPILVVCKHLMDQN